MICEHKNIVEEPNFGTRYGPIEICVDCGAIRNIKYRGHEAYPTKMTGEWILKEDIN